VDTTKAKAAYVEEPAEAQLHNARVDPCIGVPVAASTARDVAWKSEPMG